MGSGDDDSDDSSVGTVTTTTSTTSVAPAAKAEVRVFNIGTDEAAAARIGDRLREAGWNVTETGNIAAAEVTATTVYFGTAAGEQAAAKRWARFSMHRFNHEFPKLPSNHRA